MTDLLEKETLNSNSWQKVVELINKNKVEEKLLEPVDNQFYRAVLKDKNYATYIAVGIFDKEIKKPIIEVKRLY